MNPKILLAYNRYWICFDLVLRIPKYVYKSLKLRIIHRKDDPRKGLYGVYRVFWLCQDLTVTYSSKVFFR